MPLGKILRICKQYFQGWGSEHAKSDINLSSSYTVESLINRSVMPCFFLHWYSVSPVWLSTSEILSSQVTWFATFPQMSDERHLIAFRGLDAHWQRVKGTNHGTMGNSFIGLMWRMQRPKQNLRTLYKLGFSQDKTPLPSTGCTMCLQSRPTPSLKVRLTKELTMSLWDSWRTAVMIFSKDTLIPTARGPRNVLLRGVRLLELWDLRLAGDMKTDGCFFIL